MYILIWLFLLPYVNTEPFWITATLQDLQWKNDCFAIRACVEPTVTMIQNNVINKENISKSWCMNLEQEQFSNSFVSYWTQGAPEGISVAVEVSGFDSTYGFPRVCDSSASVPFYMIRSAVNRNGIPMQMSARDDETVELAGSCFSVNVVFRIHVDRCPWCSSPFSEKIKKQPTEDLMSDMQKKRTENITTLLLFAFVVLAVIGFILLVMVFAAVVLYKPFFKREFGSKTPVSFQKRKNRFTLVSPYWISGDVRGKDLSLALSTAVSERTSNISLGGDYRILSANSSERWSPCDSGVITV